MKIRGLLLLLLNSLNALANIPALKAIKHQLDAPSEQLRGLVTEAWEQMDPARPELENDYPLAFELNANAYQRGHPEGASNIGLLYEKGWGVAKDLDSAELWYMRAIAGKHHSAQAELGLARIYLTKPRIKENVNKIIIYIQQAKETALVRGSLWKEARNAYLMEADFLAVELKDYGRLRFQ
jgi:TPR repeat protein